MVEQSTVQLFHGDCIELMREMPDASVDVVVADPPYGLDIPYDTYEDTQANLALLINGFMPQAQRIANLVVVFPGIHNIWQYPTADWMGCWFYGTTGSWGRFGYNGWQPYLLYGRNNNRYGLDTIKYSKMEKRVEGHPCSKPLGLMITLVERFTSPRATVLDPFMGSGTTGVACVQTGRQFIGMEIDKGYYDIACKRIAESQLTLAEVA
jgi:site-specific DNA-methyltransferase (adenine-specific)